MSTMYKIFAGNLSFETTEDQLRNVFESHIEIEDVVIARDERTGRSRGFGFIMTRDADKGRMALRRVGKVQMDGRLVYFKESCGKKKPPARPQRGRRRGGPRTPRQRTPRPRISNLTHSPSNGNSNEGGSGYTAAGDS